MSITHPYAKVFVDSTSKLNSFFCHDAAHTTFEQIGDMGCGIVDFCEMDFSLAVEKIKTVKPDEVTVDNFEMMKRICWEAVDLLKEQHRYVTFFLNAELVRNFYVSDLTMAKKMVFPTVLFDYYIKLQGDYTDALELCLSSEVLPQYTLPERFVMLCNLKPHFTQYILQSMYAIAPITHGKFNTDKLIQFNDPAEVDTRSVLRNIHQDSAQAVSLWQYFAVQSMEEMLYLELVEMVKRGIRVKRCGLCDRYFVLADKRRRDYCDRVYKNGRTCKQLGAKLKFNETVDNDMYLQEFERVYNRMYSRYYRMDAWDSDRQTNKMGEVQFKAWTDAASQARRAYKAGEISGEDLVRRILGESEVRIEVE